MTRKDRREIARRALRRAHGDVDPDVSRIVEAVPAIMAEARRRRSIEVGADPISAVVPLARRAIPGLAAAAAVLVLVATFVGVREPSGGIDGLSDLDSLMLTGEMDRDGSDVLLEAMTGRTNGNG